MVLDRLAALDLLDADPSVEARRNIIATPLWHFGDMTERLHHDIVACLPALPDLPAKMGIALDTGPTPMLGAASADFRFEHTVLLMVATITLAVGFGVFLGLVAAMGLNTWRDTAISIFALITYATPLFWVGLMLIVVFSLNLGWFPTSGMENFAMFYEGWDRVKDIAHHLVLPTITLALFYLALYTRLMRASMLEQAGQDYVTTARAKGVTENRIMFVHVSENKDGFQHPVCFPSKTSNAGTTGSVAEFGVRAHASNCV